MKALSIHQPFAHLIATGEKWVENRTWETLYRGPLAICASKGSRYIGKEELAKYPTGCVVAVCYLKDCLHYQTLVECFVAAQKYRGYSLSQIGALLDHRHAEGPWLFLLANVFKLETPIPILGRQGLFNLPDDVAREVEGLI